MRQISPPVVEVLKARRERNESNYVFPGIFCDKAFGTFLNHCEELFKKSKLSDVKLHVLRHSFASVANDLGCTEITVAALVGYSKGFKCAILSRKLFILLHRKSYENIDMANLS